MSASADAIRALVDAGMSLREIGRAIGRDSSLLSQVARGNKPGVNLAPALAELRARVEAGEGAAPVAAPSRRTKASGAAARVRRPTIIGGNSYATGNVRRQAAGSGARSLAGLLRGAGPGVNAAVDVTFKPGVKVYNSSGGRRNAVQVDGSTVRDKSTDGDTINVAGRPTTVKLNLGQAHRAAEWMDAEFSGNFTEFALSRMASLGMIGDGTNGALAETSDVVGIELRTWRG